jgi:alpha-N-arabinofuranosidase
MYGEWQVGAMSADEYVAEATRWARAIRMIDPTLKLVSCGQSGWDDWDRTVIDGLVSHVDLHSVHIYTGAADDLTNMLHAHQAERAIRATRALIQRAAYLQQVRNPPKIAYDEWNVWYREDGSPLEERYTIADALAVGTYLNIFVRNSDVLRMANLAQLVNVIAPIVTTPDRAVVQPIYYPILLHAQTALDRAVDVFVEGDTLSLTEGPSRWPHRVADLAPFTVLDAAATASAEKIAVTVVNRADAEATVEVVLSDGTFDGPVRLRTLTAERDPSARVVPDIESARLEEGSEKPTESRVVLTLPPRSFTALEANTLP